MKIYKIFPIIVLLITGCETTSTQSVPPTVDYGGPLTIDYEAAIKNYFERALVDPYSAQYRFYPPIRETFKENVFTGGRFYAGYFVRVGVNSKNQFGGYGGMEEFGFIFRNNQIIKVIQPAELRMSKFGRRSR